ncbi:hypothetical protein MMRN_38700 [Mycobacterium marinum]|nr:hypothetical protein MMRN_38700 [Mycobacterium marinum]
MPHQKDDPEKHCEICGTELKRKRFASGRLEDRNVFLKRTHCSQACANSRRVIQADSHRWRARKIKAKDRCEDCGTADKLHIHHKDRNPANNELANLAVLCSSCHKKLHWREDRDYIVGRIRESIGDVTKQRYDVGRQYLEGSPLALLNRTATETPA